MGYFPNGTAGEIFQAQNCDRCVHNVTDPDAPGCPVWLAHFLYSYELCNEEKHPGKVILDLLIPADSTRCAMLIERGTPTPPPPITPDPPADGPEWIAWSGHRWLTNGAILVRADGPRPTMEVEWKVPVDASDAFFRTFLTIPNYDIRLTPDGDEVLRAHTPNDRYARFITSMPRRDPHVVYLRSGYATMSYGLTVWQSANPPMIPRDTEGGPVVLKRGADIVALVMPCKP
jgi:hypothetical protein